MLGLPGNIFVQKHNINFALYARKVSMCFAVYMWCPDKYALIRCNVYSVYTRDFPTTCNIQRPWLKVRGTRYKSHWRLNTLPWMTPSAPGQIHAGKDIEYILIH